MIAITDVQRQQADPLHFSVALPSVCGGISLRLASFVVKMAVATLGFALSHTKSRGRERASSGECGVCIVKARIPLFPEVPSEPSLKLCWPTQLGHKPRF